jgi:uncharacterized membrane protein
VRRADVVTGEVVIGRPPAEVYGFYRDFTNLPRFLGDVVAVEQLGARAYRWTVGGPLGARLPMTVTVTDDHPDRLIRYRTGGPPLLRARWELSFTGDRGADNGERTQVREQLRVPLGAIGRVLLAVIGKFPDREVAANLRRLKDLLETAGDRDLPRAPVAAAAFGELLGRVRPPRRRGAGH